MSQQAAPTRGELQAGLLRDEWQRESTARTAAGAPGSFQEVEIWRRQGPKCFERRLLLVQLIAGRETMAQLFEVARKRKAKK